MEILTSILVGVATALGSTALGLGLLVKEPKRDAPIVNTNCTR